ncbi:MAG: MFS transporter [Negativicutes bacterium]|jgi:ACS family hexuronate transporter-like MFS transporter
MKFTKLRWIMLIMFISGITLNYVSRNALGVLAPTLMKDLHITTQQYSWIVAAFQLAYTVFQPICGWVIDHIGLKIGFMLFAMAWSVLCMLHPLAASWQGLAGLRFFMGATEAAAAPANVKFLTEWFPANERAVAAGWSGVGFSFGAMLAPPLVIALQLQFGLQAAFIATGAMGLVWVLIWKIFYDKPAKSKYVSQEEREYILGKPLVWHKQILKRSFWGDWKSIVGIKKFYGIALPAFLAEPAWQTFSFFVPLYLATERGMNLKEIALFAWLPFLAADFGSAASGYVAKWYKKHFNFNRNNAAIWSSVSGACLMLSLTIIPFVESSYTIIALISVGGFGHQLISAVLSVLVMENFDGEIVASVNGMRGFSAWTSGFLFSLIIGAVVPYWGYNPIFMAMGFFDLIGAALMLWLIYDRTNKMLATN